MDNTPLPKLQLKIFKCFSKSRGVLSFFTVEPVLNSVLKRLEEIFDEKTRYSEKHCKRMPAKASRRIAILKAFFGRVKKGITGFLQGFGQTNFRLRMVTCHQFLVFKHTSSSSNRRSPLYNGWYKNECYRTFTF